MWILNRKLSNSSDETSSTPGKFALVMAWYSFANLLWYGCMWISLSDWMSFSATETNEIVLYRPLFPLS